MRLEKIIAGCGVTAVLGRTDIEVSAVCNDSRKVTCGALFVAVKGYAIDGHSFIAKAVDLGASAVVCEELDSAKKQTEGRDITLIQVESSRHALAVIAANFYDNPSHKLTLVGITGTNGKTTIATLLYDLYRRMGHRVGLISTVVYRIDERSIPSTHTTPDVLRLNAMLREMVDSGCDYCFMEVSSHSVVQERSDFHKPHARPPRLSRLYGRVYQGEETPV